MWRPYGVGGESVVIAVDSGNEATAHPAFGFSGKLAVRVLTLNLNIDDALNSSTSIR